MATCPTEVPVVVPELADALAVSERTLQRAFKTWAGLGPLRFFTVRRLHAFRRSIVAEGRRHGTIARAARRLGFTHLGHLSREYRSLFGESPTETLSRRT